MTMHIFRGAARYIGT